MKKARAFLQIRGLSFEFIDFKKSPPNLINIERWSAAFNGLPVNAKGTTYKKYKDEFETLTLSEKRGFLITHPSMIKRPILEKDQIVLAFGFSEDDYKKKLI